MKCSTLNNLVIAMVLLIGCGLAVGAIVTDNLVMHLTTLESSSYNGSGQTWYDMTSNNNDASLGWSSSVETGDPSYISSGPARFSLSRTGSDNYHGQGFQVADSDALDVSSTFTLEAWIRPDNEVFSYDSNIAIFDKYRNKTQSNDAGYALKLVKDESTGMGKLLFSVRNRSASSTGLVELDEWSHIAVTYYYEGGANEHGVVKFYINGQEAGSNTSVWWRPANNSDRSLLIGLEVASNADWTGQGWPARRFFNGEIAVARIYDDVLSSDEVAQNYNSEANSIPEPAMIVFLLLGIVGFLRKR